MSAQGEGILAWLESAITAWESAAQEACSGGMGRWSSGWSPDWPFDDEDADAYSSGAGVSDERDETIVYDEGGRPNTAQPVHIALNDPASVLRRCAADRQLLSLHGDRSHSCPAKGANGFPDEWTEFGRADICPVVQLLAEGYGWTEVEG